MKNKKTFELPEYLPMDMNNFARKDCVEASGQVEDHTNFLKKQLFCLNLMEFFTEFPNVCHLKLFARQYGDNLVLRIFTNGKKEEERGNTIYKYLHDNISYSDLQKFARMKDSHFIIRKDHIPAAWEEWMGEENYQKWKSLDMEAQPQEHTKSAGKYKKIFELPEYFPMNANNSVIKDFSKALRQAEDHVDLLRQQFFCLNLMKFFTEFPDVYDLGLFSHTYGYDNYILGPYINGKQEECQTTMFKYFEDTISYLDREQLEGMSGLIVKKDNIQAAWEKWMGEENYQKWKCLDMEDKLREHTKPLDESKQKRKRI